MPTASYLLWADMGRWYLRAVYWATCNLTGLGKDLVPLKEGPLVFTLIVFLIGVLVFACKQLRESEPRATAPLSHALGRLSVL